ncbi:hypothetical protein MPH_09125 [Macrophomina phaseolina MS6]|uniref:NmrA-like protein n=1 Tax=Macrophomina phaseolina (strain MS6) TaxID=1126212 RepID=K2S9U2_MACPH|nr:hypothetical protein MPH_09125 [Macrophomina phaseolina MS6]
MRELSAKTSFLQVGYYLDNWSFIKGDIRGDRDEGFYHAGLGNVEEKIPFVWAQRDTGPLVKTLVEAEAGVNLLGYSELLTWKEYMQMWGRVLGVKLGGDCGSGYKSVSAEEIKAGIQGPEEMKMEALESMQYVQEFGWTGGEPGVLHPKDVSVSLLAVPMRIG